MASVNLYFQLHQPYRLRNYNIFEADHNYFDHSTNLAILQRVAEKCYIPVTEMLLDLIEQHAGDFRISFSITGILLDQLQTACPRVIQLFKQLAQTGCVEFLGETYYHSLAAIFSQEEFDTQIKLHSQAIEQLFGQRPNVFRNTELIYSNELGAHVAKKHGFKGILAEGVDHILDGRSANYIYQSPSESSIKLLLKNYALSDDIAFRFSDSSWDKWPMTAEKFTQWVTQSDGDVCNLFMDYETFGEHQWAETGILEFLKVLPKYLINEGGHQFLTPSQSIKQHESKGICDMPVMTSWADTERDLSAWLGNAMQTGATHELYLMEQAVKQSNDKQLLEDWRRLTASDHFYYMCTKYYNDGAVHKYFNPYDSPYDSYINYMNVLENMRIRLGIASDLLLI